MKKQIEKKPKPGTVTKIEEEFLDEDTHITMTNFIASKKITFTPSHMNPHKGFVFIGSNKATAKKVLSALQRLLKKVE